ncbi:MAG: helix-turn-helix domain-containing protein [Actinoallomurus sp.]
MTDDQPDSMASRTRDGHGRFDRDPETAKRDAEAARLRGRGWTFQRIADELGVSKQTAYDAVQRALADTLTEPAAEARTLELERLDSMHAAVLAVLEAKHFTVSQGKVVRLDDEPLEDDAPVLQAVDRLLRIAERRAKLLGLDAPAKAEIAGQLTYEVVGVGDAEL